MVSVSVKSSNCKKNLYKNFTVLRSCYRGESIGDHDEQNLHLIILLLIQILNHAPNTEYIAASASPPWAVRRSIAADLGSSRISMIRRMASSS